MPGMDADFLGCLPQGRGHRVGIVGLGPAPGKADLAGVVTQVLGAPRQQQVKAIRPHHQRHQHRGSGGCALWREAGAIAPELRFETGQAAAETRAQCLRCQPVQAHRWQVVIDGHHRDGGRIGDARDGRHGGQMMRQRRQKTSRPKGGCGAQGACRLRSGQLLR